VNKTSENLQAAFAGESQASRKYLYFAEKAEEEGYKQIARLFRAASDAETVHARNHLKAMKGIESTKDNLKTAINGENYEFTKMYPGFIEQADADGDVRAKRSFNLANTVEQIHHRLYQTALSTLEKGEDMAEKPLYVCQVCGYTVEGEAPAKCPICGASREMFKRID
jgi:rubrerythrin